jgi:hypothetical protein
MITLSGFYCISKILFRYFRKSVVVIEPAIFLVPLSVVSDPLVTNPLLAKQNRTSRVTGEDIRNIACPDVVPKDS